MYKTVLVPTRNTLTNEELCKLSDCVQNDCKVPKRLVQNCQRSFTYKLIIVYTLLELETLLRVKGKNEKENHLKIQTNKQRNKKKKKKTYAYPKATKSP